MRTLDAVVLGATLATLRLKHSAGLAGLRHHLTVLVQGGELELS